MKKFVKSVEEFKFAYGRVSTVHQKLDSQLEEFKKLGIPAENIFTDKASGKSKANREGLNALFEELKKHPHGTCKVYITRLSRLGRSLKDLCEIMEFFDSLGVKSVFLKENLSFTGPVGRLILHVLCSINEFERELIVEATKEGIAASKANKGTVFGRKPVPNEIKNRVIKLSQSGEYTVKEILEMCGVSRASYYRILKSVS